MLICGPAGTGKSHVAQALGYAACQRGCDVLYTKAPRLFADLGGGHADGTWESRLRRYLQPHLLIIDDFGLRELGVQQAEDLYELICGRYQRASTIVVPTALPKTGTRFSPTRCWPRGLLTGWLTTPITSSWWARATGPCTGQTVRASWQLGLQAHRLQQIPHCSPPTPPLHTHQITQHRIS